MPFMVQKLLISVTMIIRILMKTLATDTINTSNKSIELAKCVGMQPFQICH